MPQRTRLPINQAQMTRFRFPRVIFFLLALAGCLGPGPSPTPAPLPPRTPPPTLPPATATSAPPLATATLAPPRAGPATPPRPAALTWRQAATEHFTYYYLPGSQAEHDLPQIMAVGEQALQDAAAALGVSPTARLQVYFANRIFWQGGASYPDNVLLLSYPDPARDYVASDLGIVLRHETTHALVAQLVGEGKKGGLLGEGVAVWAAGGHYHREPLDTPAATLVGENTDLYIPLATLHTDFYNQQHEIAYLEGTAFVQYLIARNGLPAFKQFLATPDTPETVYHQTWVQLEQGWRAALLAPRPTAADAQAVRLRVRYYDLMRRYEEQRDPDARRLPDAAPPAWDAALIAAFSRPNSLPANITLEHTLVAAGQALWARDLPHTEALLDQVTATLAPANR